MKRVMLFAAISAGMAVYLNGSVSDPASWAIVLAGVTGGALMGGRPKQPIGLEEERRA